MLASIKALLKFLLAPAMYLCVWVVSIIGAVRRADLPLYLLAILAPIPTLWYPLQALPFGNSTLDFLFAATAIGIVTNKGGYERSRNALVVALFCLVILFGLLVATLRFDLPAPVTTANPALQDWKNYTQMVLLYFLAHDALKTEDDQKRMLVIMAVVVFLIAFREFRNFSQGEMFSYDRRAMGPFWIVGLGANHFGAFMAHFGLLMFGMFLVDKHKRRRWLYLAACLFSLHPLFFTYSRGAWAAAVVGLFVLGLLRARILLVGLLALALTWQAVLPDTVVERIQMTEQDDGQLEDSAAERVYLWQHAWQVFSDNPVVGVGFTGFRMIRAAEGFQLTDPHNFYLKMAADFGMVGLLALGLLLLGALRSGWRLFRLGRSEFHRALGLGFLACTSAMLVSNIFGDRFSYFALNAYFFLLWGMADRALLLSTQAQAAPAAVAATAAGMPTTQGA
jgi:O-antigen ligase